MAAVHDNLYSLFRRDVDSPFNDSGHVQRMVDSLLDRGQLEMAAITYLRGRSITDEFVIVDEAQNLELPTLKVILTRMALGSKVVFCGDLSQVDNPYISPYGGMAALIEKLKGLEVGKRPLIVTEDANENLYLSARNLPYVEVRDVQGLDPVALVGADSVVVTADSVPKIAEWLA